MTVQQSKRRPLSRYLKDFKHSQTHCAHCHKLLDRITLVRRGEIVNKIAISRLDTLMDEAAWQEEQKEWVANRTLATRSQRVKLLSVWR
jgi:FliZ protein